MSKNIVEQLENKLTTQQKSAFTREWNKRHKDPTYGVKGKKIKEVISDEEEEEFDVMLDED